ncbi:phospholipid carrier-dependent glycosyltransferase [Alteraurantiacibacter buctensis]|uniref:Polyprenol-phosphate-mannose--protein mannosyltransferase n=1 Tax=Alteraurantiacibacter buctensis TaxID=1503981 RepID=A0A844YWP0_9SPHN|nr:phospholipid carrier-dependent glycosyltransferase [Alteraurantiacibacter buctensis]MXO71378.1 phospholipid carrier-dependent glycosyltransferase [Alteraurantiacibacter buctensis]
MSQPPHHPADPICWHIVITALFAVLACVRLTIPSGPMFDEVHYMPAARNLLALSDAVNLEHPPLGKELIALGMLLFGDEPLGWRIMPLLFGILALFGAVRAMWFLSLSRAASLLTGLFLVTGFPLLLQARIAMLDVFMLSFVMLGLWQCAGAYREPETARWRLALGGAALGLAMAAKWNAIPIAMLPGLAFFIARAWQGRAHFLTSNRGWPIGGMTLAEAALWLAVVPLLAYAATYWPFPFYATVPGNPTGLIALHRQMLDLQTQVLPPHPYQSQWWQWASNTRAIWYLYEVTDGAQRGVLMMGNPLSSLAALPALLWCGWAWWKQGRRDCAALLVLYLVSMALWVLAPKPVQFYYHYVLPHCFAMAALALGVEKLWQNGERLTPAAIVLGSTGVFVWFYPILTAAPLAGEQAFLDYAWLVGWR